MFDLFAHLSKERTLKCHHVSSRETWFSSCLTVTLVRRSCPFSTIFVNLRIFEIPYILHLSVDRMKASPNFSRERVDRLPLNYFIPVHEIKTSRALQMSPIRIPMAILLEVPPNRPSQIATSFTRRVLDRSMHGENTARNYLKEFNPYLTPHLNSSPTQLQPLVYSSQAPLH